MILHGSPLFQEAFPDLPPALLPPVPSLKSSATDTIRFSLPVTIWTLRCVPTPAGTRTSLQEGSVTSMSREPSGQG